MLAWLGKSKVKGPAGVAITARGLAVAEFSAEQTAPVLTSCGFFPATEAFGQDQLSHFAKERKWQGRRLAVCLDHSQFTFSQVEAPAVEAEELSQALAWRVKEQIDFPFEELVLDYVDLPPIRSAAQMLYTVSSRHSTIQHIVDQADSGAAKLERIDIPAFALQNLLCRLPLAEEGVGLLNLMKQNSLLTLGRQGRLYLSREIDISSDELRAGAGNTDDFSGNHLFDDLLLTVQRSLDYYDSMFTDPPIKYLLVCNGNGWFDELIEYLSRNLQIAVAGLDLKDALTASDEIQLDPEWYGELLLAMGTALWPLEESA